MNTRSSRLKRSRRWAKSAAPRPGPWCSAERTACARPAPAPAILRRARPSPGRDGGAPAPRRPRCGSPRANDRRRDPSHLPSVGAARSTRSPAPARTCACAWPSRRSPPGSRSRPTGAQRPRPARCAGPLRPGRPAPRSPPSHGSRSAPRAHQPLQLPARLERVQSAEGGDHPLVDLTADPPALGDLEVDASA